MYTYNLFALVCIHSRCLCTRLCNIGVLFHLYIYVYTSLTTGLHMSALVCVGPRARLHVCTWHHLFPCTCACLHLVSLIFTCFCLAPLVSVCLHLSVVFLMYLVSLPVYICTHFPSFVLAFTFDIRHPI